MRGVDAILACKIMRVGKYRFDIDDGSRGILDARL
jgi:hypothetical protein